MRVGQQKADAVDRQLTCCPACGRIGHTVWECEPLVIKLWLDAYVKKHPGREFKEALRHWDERYKHLHGLREPARQTRGNRQRSQVSMAKSEDDALWSKLEGVQQAFHFATNNEFCECEPEVLLACLDYQDSELGEFGAVDLNL